MAKKTNGDNKVPEIQNFVAKHSRTFNKAQVHRDRTKYHRKEKHRKSDDYGAFFITRIVDSLLQFC